MDTKSKIYLTWEDIDYLTNILARNIGSEVDSIMGLPRGGLIPAVMLSHKLNLPLVATPTENTLIVDDICDSGETFKKIRNQHPHNTLVCLHMRSSSKFIPDLWIQTHVGDEWLVYPWERDDSDTIQDYLK